MTAALDWAELPPDPSLETLTVEHIGDAQCAVVQELSTLADILIEPVIRGPSSTAPAAPRHHYGRPVLLPRRIADRIEGDRYAVTEADISDPELQYLYLGAIKNAGGDHNTPAADLWYRRHLYRSRALLADAEGLVLDVGCDDPALSRRLFPPSVRYVGLDPGLGPRHAPCLVGMAEFLPFTSASLDAVAFLTSLDHVLDYASALEEAFRVLRPGGRLYLATLIWTHRAELIHDTIHFHHFRQYEIEGALRTFRVERLTRYCWKDDEHRFGVYLVASKPAAP